MVALYAYAQSYLPVVAKRITVRHRRAGGDLGQATAEYALVLIGAAAVALLLVAWASKTDRIGRLFDFVLDHITGRAR